MEDFGVRGTIILEWILDDVDWIHLAQDRNYEHGNETTGFIKGGKFLDYLSDYHLYKVSSPCT